MEVYTSPSNIGATVTLKNVLYVPDAEDNLLSISCIDKEGGQIQFAQGQAFLLDKNNCLVAKANLNNQLYILNFYRKAERSKQANVTHLQPNSWNEWHKHLRQMGISGLKWLKNGNLVDSFDADTDSLFLECELCIVAKQAYTPFPDHTEQRNTVPGKLIHTNLWRPTST